MKSILIQSIFWTLIFSVDCFCQLETFEDDTANTLSFSTDGFVFNTTGDMFVEFYEDLGCNSDQWLGSGFGDGGTTSTSFGSIEVGTVGHRFVLSTSTALCAWTSNDDGNNFAVGDVQFVGTLAAGGTISETFTITPPDNFNFDMITFSNAIWGGQELTRLTFNIISGVNYLALDNITFDDLITTPIVSISTITNSTIENSGTNLVYRFTRTGNNSSTLTVNFSISGTAADADYNVVTGGTELVTYNVGTNTGTITFPVNSTTVDLTVTPAGDTEIEADETVLVMVENP
ncbi:MAG: hypothetical protein R3E32_26690 [Chitinophagales bacterium]